MVQPNRLLRRIPVALLIALAVSAAVGGALAGSDVAEAPAEDRVLSIPAPRLGDKGAYQLTLTGDWNRSDVASTDLGQAPIHDPWLALEFAWQEAGIGQDASGSSGPADELALTTREWDLDSSTNPLSWRLEDTGGAYLHRSGDASPYQRSHTATETEAADGIDEVPLLATNVGAGATYRVDEQRDIVPHCFFAFQGKDLHLDGTIEWPARSCSLEFLPDSWYAVKPLGDLYLDQRFQVVGRETIAGHPAVHLSTKGASFLDHTDIWVSEGLPYPLRVALARDAFTAGNHSFPQRTATFDLVAYEAGLGERTERGPWTGGLPQVALAARQPWIMDEAGVTHPFPLSEAYTYAVANNATLADFLDEVPDAYMSSAIYNEHALYGQRDRTWSFILTNATRRVEVQASESVPDALDVLPNPLRDPTVSRQASASITDLDYFVLDPSLVPRQVPTVAATTQRWRDFGGQGTPNGWWFSMACASWSSAHAVCQEVRVAFAAGESWSEVHTVDERAIGQAQVPVRQSWLSHMDAVAIDLDGSMVRHTRQDNDWSGNVGLVPQDLGASGDGGADGFQAAPRPFWQPTPTQAAGAGAVGLLVGLLYFLWPAIKAGPLALFSRIEGPQLLDHPVRARLSLLVVANPGIHFKELRRQSGLANGVIVHHLDKLAASGLVQVKAAGRYRCYFPPNTGAVNGLALAAVKADGAQKVIAAVRSHPGADVRALAASTGLGRSTVHYHLQRLQEAGLVRQTPVLHGMEGQGATWVPTSA